MFEKRLGYAQSNAACRAGNNGNLLSVGIRAHNSFPRCGVLHFFELGHGDSILPSKDKKLFVVRFRIIRMRSTEAT